MDLQPSDSHLNSIRWLSRPALSAGRIETKDAVEILAMTASWYFKKTPLNPPGIAR
jgi:hypothetical protein